jgi:hypothetical protein
MKAESVPTGPLVIGAGVMADTQQNLVFVGNASGNQPRVECFGVAESNVLRSCNEANLLLAEAR